MRRHEILRMALASLLMACATGRSASISPSGLGIRVLAKGSGAIALRGQRVSIHETTTLRNGSLIYSSRSGSPITFTLGAKQVIDGVDEGVTGMRVGERRLLTVPPSLSQRTSYPDNTPRDSVLLIDVELVAIRQR